MLLPVMLACLMAAQNGQAEFAAMRQALAAHDQQPVPFEDGFLRCTLEAEGKVGDLDVRFANTYRLEVQKGVIRISSQVSGGAKGPDISWAFSDAGVPPEMEEALKIGWMRFLYWSPSRKSGWLQIPALFQNRIHAVWKTDSDSSASDLTMQVEVPDVGLPDSEFGKAVEAKNKAWVKQAASEDGRVGGWTSNILQVPANSGKAAGVVHIPMAGTVGNVLPSTWNFGPAVDAHAAKDDQVLHGTLTIQYAVGDVPEQPELEVTIGGYDQWIPTVDTDAPDFEGATLKVRAELKRKDGKPLEPDQKASKISFYLRNTSHEPGIACSFPATDPKSDPDLKFIQRRNPDLKLSDDDGQSAWEEGTGLTKAEAAISPFDTGGFCTLQVIAETAAGQVFGELKDRKGKPILIPRREPDSLVATSWKQQKGVADLKDDDDSESNPKIGNIKGDGFTLYEEYRGIVEDHEMTRLEPKQVDLCLYIKSERDSVRDGALTFGGGTGITVHRHLKDGECGRPITTGCKVDKVMNFNHDQGPHSVDQHCLLIFDGHTEDGSNVTYVTFKDVTSPKDTSFIMIDLDFSEWLTSFENGSLSVTPLLKTSVAHEISHACGVRHHGDLPNETLLVRVAKDGTSLEGALYDRKAKKAGAFAPLDLRYDDHDERPVPPTDPVFSDGGELLLTVERQHGTCSGNADCWMRYLIGNAYRLGGKVYWNNKGDRRSESICDSPNGTGTNASDRKPHPRFGDASKGDCSHQICITDHHS